MSSTSYSRLPSLALLLLLVMVGSLLCAARVAAGSPATRYAAFVDGSLRLADQAFPPSVVQSALAHGSLGMSQDRIGWYVLDVHTHPQSNPESTFYAAGYVEGGLTASSIYDSYTNVENQMFGNQTVHQHHPQHQNKKTMVYQWIGLHVRWLRRMALTRRHTDRYWQVIYLFLRQIEGITHGYNAHCHRNVDHSFPHIHASKGPHRCQLSINQIFMLNMDGDLETVVPMLSMDLTKLMAEMQKIQAKIDRIVFRRAHWLAKQQHQSTSHQAVRASAHAATEHAFHTLDTLVTIPPVTSGVSLWQALDVRPSVPSDPTEFASLSSLEMQLGALRAHLQRSLGRVPGEATRSPSESGGHARTPTDAHGTPLTADLDITSYDQFLRLNEPFQYGGMNHYRCSALVKVAPDGRDVFVAHDTWDSYGSLVRTYKHYHWHLCAAEATGRPGRSSAGSNCRAWSPISISFPSYPAVLSSIDDFYVTSQGLVVTETTNGFHNPQLYSLVTGFDRFDTPAPAGQQGWGGQGGGVMSFMRAMMANVLAKSGAQWTNLFRRYNSGTYNNQWMVVDFNVFNPPSCPVQSGSHCRNLNDNQLGAPPPNPPFHWHPLPASPLYHPKVCGLQPDGQPAGCPLWFLTELNETAQWVSPQLRTGPPHRRSRASPAASGQGDAGAGGDHWDSRVPLDGLTYSHTWSELRRGVSLDAGWGGAEGAAQACVDQCAQLAVNPNNVNQPELPSSSHPAPRWTHDDHSHAHTHKQNGGTGAGAAVPDWNLSDGLLTIIEQLPGYTQTADVTGVLRDKGFWPSYNVPYFYEVWRRSGFADMFRMDGDEWSHDRCARARIFARDAPLVRNLGDMQRLMTSNDYQNDPLSRGNPADAIMSRYDLMPEYLTAGASTGYHPKKEKHPAFHGRGHGGGGGGGGDGAGGSLVHRHAGSQTSQHSNANGKHPHRKGGSSGGSGGGGGTANDLTKHVKEAFGGIDSKVTSFRLFMGLDPLSQGAGGQNTLRVTPAAMKHTPAGRSSLGARYSTPDDTPLNATSGKSAHAPDMQYLRVVPAHAQRAGQPLTSTGFMSVLAYLGPSYQSVDPFSWERCEFPDCTQTAHRNAPITYTFPFVVMDPALPWPVSEATTPEDGASAHRAIGSGSGGSGIGSSAGAGAGAGAATVSTSANHARADDALIAFP